MSCDAAPILARDAAPIRGVVACGRRPGESERTGSSRSVGGQRGPTDLFLGSTAPSCIEDQIGGGVYCKGFGLVLHVKPTYWFCIPGRIWCGFKTGTKANTV